MVKRVLAINVLMLTAVLFLHAKAEAHLIYSAGRWLTHSSINCEQVIDKARNPDVHLALSECAITASLVQVLCVNPSGHEVTGAAATNITAVTAGEIDFDQLSKEDKKKGKVNLSLVVEDPAALFNPQFCVGGQGGSIGGGDVSQWTVVDVEILEFVARGELSECIGPTDVPCSSLLLSSTIQANCALPPPFSVTNPPDPGIEYDCGDPIIEHVGH